MNLESKYVIMYVRRLRRKGLCEEHLLPNEFRSQIRHSAGRVMFQPFSLQDKLM